MCDKSQMEVAWCPPSTALMMMELLFISSIFEHDGQSRLDTLLDILVNDDVGGIRVL